MRVNAETDNMYPNYFIPPYHEGRKLRLVQGYLPKTNILYANHYELEIMRLLCLLAPEDETVRKMAEGTLDRLGRTCFGNSCTQGECLAAGISGATVIFDNEKGGRHAGDTGKPDHSKAAQ